MVVSGHQGEPTATLGCGRKQKRAAGADVPEYDDYNLIKKMFKNKCRLLFMEK